jgi:hypothetical protein
MVSLPIFAPNASEREWVRNEIRTARLIRSFWNAAGRKRRDPEFVALFVQCGWTNVRWNGAGVESTRLWRNKAIARYLGIKDKSDEKLSQALSATFPKLRHPTALLESFTGITAYYPPFRPATIRFVKSHAAAIADALSQVASETISSVQKAALVVDMILALGPIHVLGKKVSPLNSLTPAFACLDPSQRFPIMNQRTDTLLRKIGNRHDADGAVALCRLIGKNKIRNSLELDVYANTVDFSRVRTPRMGKAVSKRYRDVGDKSEMASIALIAANRVRILKRHNRLTNRLRDHLLWRHIIAKECDFDIFIPNWKGGRHLLIEAKTASTGPTGREQIRQAIGQLFDYRHSHFQNEKVDLAVLLPSEPPPDVASLLTSLKIGVIWFRKDKLGGTIKL